MPGHTASEADTSSASEVTSTQKSRSGGRVLRWWLPVLALLVGVTGGFLLRGAFVAEPPQGASAVDIGFAQDMITHHQQAVVMTQLVAGKLDPDTAALAEQIRDNQLIEIGQMQGWLTAWNAPMQSEHPMAWMMSGHDGMAMDGPMPGMATQDELNQLSAVPPAQAEVMFLQLMLRHHEGGLPMAAYAAQHASHPVVMGTAQNISLEQTQESALIQQMLAQRNAAQLPR
jgi:uncharacterized protein (DUF305 family)